MIDPRTMSEDELTAAVGEIARRGREKLEQHDRAEDELYRVYAAQTGVPGHSEPASIAEEDDDPLELEWLRRSGLRR